MGSSSDTWSALGKQFEAVRVQYGDKDVCLKNPVRLILQRHTDGKGFGPSPAHISDGAASSLLEDMIRANPDQEAALSEILRAIGGRYRV